MCQLYARIAFTLAAALFLAGPAAAQYYPANGWYRSGPPYGYWVRNYGYYDGTAAPPGYGTHEAYYEGRPWVTVADPWGRVADVPLRPKVLYYSDQILTPYGGFYPTHIVVIPNDRRPAPVRTYRAPAAPAAPAPATIPAPPPRPALDPPPAPRQPAAAPEPAADPGAPRLGPAPELPKDLLIPPAADLDARRPAAAPPPPTDPPRPAPKVPAVPELPRLPEVPALPGAARKPAVPEPRVVDDAAPPAPAATVPKLGPTPADSSPPK